MAKCPFCKEDIHELHVKGIVTGVLSKDASCTSHMVEQQTFRWDLISCPHCYVALFSDIDRAFEFLNKPS